MESSGSKRKFFLSEELWEVLSERLQEIIM
jgi:hypothetical protein